MITTVQELKISLKRKHFAGVILYEGKSQIDGEPIVAIANRITTKSDNEKTGDMVQTFIIRSDVDPVTALKLGLDSSVCGDCMHRPVNKGSCYVNVGRSVRSVYGAYERGRYARPGVDYDIALLPELFRGMAFRMGTYGDPCAVPYQIWRACTLFVAVKNGYTHQWKHARFAAFKTLCMASADSVEDMTLAHALGWRTFRVRGAGEPIVARVEAACPASKEMGYRTNCASCKACGGLEAKAKVSMVIMAHGATASRFAA